jgi:acyl-CoA dehydrogenase
LTGIWQASNAGTGHGEQQENPLSDFEQYLSTIRELTRNVFIPHEAQMEAEGDVPPQVVQAIKESGLFGISLPDAYGGMGWTQEQQVLLTFEFTYASSVYRSIFSTTIGLCSQAILDFATESQCQTYLPAMAAGDCIGAFCLTEPDAGSDAGSLATSARLDGPEYVINGQKRYITNASIADVLIVMARTDPASSGAAGISAIFVDPGTPGITITRMDNLLGQRGTVVNEIEFRDCRVPVANLVGGVEGLGLRAALRGINSARMHVAATAVGQAQRLLDEALTYAREREQFGQPIGEFGTIQAMLADSYTEIQAARAMTLEAARLFDTGVASGQLPQTEIAAAKYYASEMVTRVADRALQILGGKGFVENNIITQFYRDTRLFRLFEGTSQIQQRNIARALVRDQR